MIVVHSSNICGLERSGHDVSSTMGYWAGCYTYVATIVDCRQQAAAARGVTKDSVPFYQRTIMYKQTNFSKTFQDFSLKNMYKYNYYRL